MVQVDGRVEFNCPAAAVYRQLARGVQGHTVGCALADEELDRPVTVLTRYATVLWFGTVRTTEEASLDPGRSITWRHVEGPLTGSRETFTVVPHGEGAVVEYRGSIRARHPLFRGPLERLFVAPMTRSVSLGALRDARDQLERT